MKRGSLGYCHAKVAMISVVVPTVLSRVHQVVDKDNGIDDLLLLPMSKWVNWAWMGNNFLSRPLITWEINILIGVLTAQSTTFPCDD